MRHGDGFLPVAASSEVLTTQIAGIGVSFIHVCWCAKSELPCHWPVAHATRKLAVIAHSIVIRWVFVAPAFPEGHKHRVTTPAKPSENPADSPQNPAEPRRTLRETRGEPSERQISRMVTLRNFRSSILRDSVGAPNAVFWANLLSPKLDAAVGSVPVACNMFVLSRQFSRTML